MFKKAVILSGGIGSRLRPFTEVIPKPLLPIGEKAILEIQIERFKKFGFDHIYLATNYKSEYIQNFFGDGSRYGVELMISREEKPLGTAGPLKLLQNDLSDGPFIVMNGDILSLVDFNQVYEFASKYDGPLTVCIKKILTPYAFGNILFEGDIVTLIEEKPDIVTYALAGIYVMKPSIFEFIPNNEYYGMDALIKKLLAEGKPIYKYEIKDYWIDIGRIEDYEKAQHAYKEMYNES
jgi:NDP-mannose synthase